MSGASERSAKKRPPAPTQDEHSKRIFRNTLHGRSAWDRHKAYVERYLRMYGGDGGQAGRRLSAVHHRNDWDVLKERHRFLRKDDVQVDSRTDGDGTASYDDEVAKKYYRSLFKDLVVADLKHFKSGNVALRWRSEDDVIDGIGQFSECALATGGSARAFH